MAPEDRVARIRVCEDDVPVWIRRILTAGLALVAGCACAREYRRDYDGIVPGTHGAEAVATLVVDARTGRPLPRATVRLVREVIDYKDRIAPPVATFRADRYGIVSMRWSKEFFDCRWIFDHPGNAARDVFAGTGELVELRPGVTVSGRLFRGDQPAAGATIEHFIGCPHGAVVRTAKTDAQGRYRMRDVDPGASWLWALLPDGAAEMIDPRLLPVPGFRQAPIRLGPGITVTGRVVGRDDEPLAEVVVVYTEQTPRGPRTVTASDGSFTLLGVDPDAQVKAARGRFDGLARTVAPPPADLPDEEPVGPGPVLVDLDHPEYGFGRAVETNGERKVPTPGELAFPPDARAEVYDLRYGEWIDVGPKAYLLQPGAFVRLTADGKLPRHARLEGAGPWTLSWGTAALEFRGLPEGAVVIVDGHLFRDPKLLGGLEPGAHTLLIGAAGRAPVAMRVILKAETTRRIDGDLKRADRG